MSEIQNPQDKSIDMLCINRQRKVFNDLGIFTLGDLSDYMSKHLASALLSIRGVSSVTVANCIVALSEYNLGYHKNYDAWLDDYRHTTAGAKWWTVRNDRIHEGKDPYGRSTKKKIKVKFLDVTDKPSNSPLKDDEVDAEVFFRVYINHGMNALATCKYLGYPSNISKQTANSVARKFRQILIDSDRISPILKELEDLSVEMYHTAQASLITLLDAEKTIALSYYDPDTDSWKKERVTEPDNNARVRAAAEIVKMSGQNINLNVKTEKSQIPSNQDEAAVFLANEVLRTIDGIGLDVPSFIRVLQKQQVA